MHPSAVPQGTTSGSSAAAGEAIRPPAACPDYDLGYRLSPRGRAFLRGGAKDADGKDVESQGSVALICGRQRCEIATARVVARGGHLSAILDSESRDRATGAAGAAAHSLLLRNIMDKTCVLAIHSQACPDYDPTFGRWKSARVCF